MFQTSGLYHPHPHGMVYTIPLESWEWLCPLEKFVKTNLLDYFKMRRSIYLNKATFHKMDFLLLLTMPSLLPDLFQSPVAVTSAG